MIFGGGTIDVIAFNTALAALVAAVAAALSANAARISARSANFEAAWAYSKEIAEWNEALLKLIEEMKQATAMQEDRNNMIRKIIQTNDSLKSLALRAKFIIDDSEPVFKSNLKEIFEYWNEDQNRLREGERGEFSTERYMKAQIALVDAIAALVQVEKRNKLFWALLS